MMIKLGKGYQWSAKLTIISLPYLPLERLVLVSNSANNKRSLAMVSRNRRNVKCATCATPSFMELLLAAVCKTWKCDRGKNMRLTKGQFSPRPLQCCRGEKCPELCLNNRRSRSPPPSPHPDRRIRSCLRMNKGSPFHIDTSLCKTKCQFMQAFDPPVFGEQFALGELEEGRLFPSIKAVDGNVLLLYFYVDEKIFLMRRDEKISM